MKRHSLNDNLIVSTCSLLRRLEIPVTYTHVSETLRRHPDFPSLLSLAESLPEWGVDAIGVRGEVEDLSDADSPSIVHLSDNGHRERFGILNAVGSDSVQVYDPVRGDLRLELADFAEIWSGVLLRVSPQPDAGEMDFRKHRRGGWISAARNAAAVIGFPVLCLSVIALGLRLNGYPLPVLLLSLVKMAGLALCAVMVSASLGEGGFLRALCPAGRLANCSRVMRSPAGKLFGISMSEWGLLYFGGGLVTLMLSMFSGHLTSDLLLLGLLGLLALPYTLFSVVYQAFVVRSWCWMCLAVMGLFWVEFLVVNGHLHSQVNGGFSGMAFSPVPFIGFASVLLVWVVLRGILANARKVEPLERQAAQLRRRPDFIHLELSRTEKTNQGSMPFEVEVGPRGAGTVITAVVNPLCGHCWRAVHQLDKLIKLGRGTLKGVIRFLVTPDSDEGSPTEDELYIDRQVSLHILAIASTGDSGLAHEALTSWFSEGRAFSRSRYIHWRAEHPVQTEEPCKKSAEVLKLHLNWARENRITGTPCFFFNGRRLPEGMQLEDMKIYILRRLEN